MSAETILVQTQRAYSFAVSNEGTSSAELLRYVNAGPWVSGIMLVTLYSWPAAWAAGVQLTVDVQDVSPARDDPATLYLKGSNQVITLTNADTPPTLRTASLQAPLGDYLRVVLSVLNASGTAQVVEFTMGVKLVGRNA
jgi:hypothetical protein